MGKEGSDYFQGSSKFMVQVISQWCEEGVLHGDTIWKNILSIRNNGGSGDGKTQGEYI